MQQKSRKTNKNDHKVHILKWHNMYGMYMNESGTAIFLPNLKRIVSIWAVTIDEEHL